MSASVNEYFVREALEYVERLTNMLEGGEALDADAALRLTAAVRGCIRMAGADRLQGLTERLEASARAAHAERGGWTAEERDLALRTLRELDHLLRALDRWGPNENLRLLELTESWKRTDAEPVSVSDLFYADEGPHIVEEGEAADASGQAAQKEERPVVPVSDLFFRGEGALQEALSLRPRVEALLSGGENAPERAELLDELFDLIELGRTSEADGG